MSNRTKKLIRFVAPSVLSMVSFFLFTVIDGIFVGAGVGTDALGAINLTYPFIMILNAFSMLFMMGGTTITAIRIGRGDEKGANTVFLHSVMLTLVMSAVISILAVFFTEPVCRMLGADGVFVPLSMDYLFWYGLFFVPVSFCICINGFCRNDNDPIRVSVAMIIATTFNIVADWVFIFPLHMGLKGAAIATGISQVILLIIVMGHFVRKKGILRFGKFRPDKDMIKKIIIRGLPECISQFSIPVSTILTNIMLMKYIGNIGVNAYAVIAYVASFSIAVFAGTAEGLQPLFGNCYGSKREDDLKYYLKRGLLISTVGALAILVILFFADRGICRLYAVNAETMELTIASMFKYSWGFLIQAVTVIISAYLYSTTRTKPAVLINFLRSFAVNIAVILILPMLFGADSVWYTFGTYESIVMVVAIILLKKYDRNGAIGTTPE